MKRSAFIAAVLGLVPILSGQSRKTVKKFYVTGGRHEKGEGDCEVSPIICYGTDRLDALSRSGITVWTEDEWHEFQRRIGEEFRKGCKDMQSLKRALEVQP